MTEIIIILALVVANGIFAGAEIAIVAVRRSRVEELADEGRGGARAVLALRDAPERFLATVQVGITVIGATAAAFGGASVAERLAAAFAGLGWVGEHAEGVALGLVVAGVSFLSIVVGELVPKSLALRDAEPYALFVAKPLLALSWLATPLVWLLSSSANLLLRPFGDRTTFTETRHSAEELQQLVEEAVKAGTVHPDAGEIASRALELPELVVEELMVPRRDVVMVSRSARQDELRQLVLAHSHSRMPVFDGHVDNIVGYVAVKDLLTRSLAQTPFTVDDVLRSPFFVPESKKAVTLLQEMRARHMPFAVVVDELGGTSGIVTMEDLLEELVGEIFSEHVEHAPEIIQREPTGALLVQGTAPIRDVNRAAGVELPEDGAWTTVAGLCLALAGRVPSAGETLRLPSGVELEVVEASPRRVRAVRVRIPPRESAPGGDHPP